MTTSLVKSCVFGVKYPPFCPKLSYYHLVLLCIKYKEQQTPQVMHCKLGLEPGHDRY